MVLVSTDSTYCWGDRDIVEVIDQVGAPCLNGDTASSLPDDGDHLVDRLPALRFLRVFLLSSTSLTPAPAVRG